MRRGGPPAVTTGAEVISTGYIEPATWPVADPRGDDAAAAASARLMPRRAENVPWWQRNAAKTEQWKASLRARGVDFAIGNGPCKQRSRRLFL